MDVERVSKSDFGEVKKLLESYNLPIEDLEDPNLEIFALRDGVILMGCIGLERFSNLGLLRSLAVQLDYRGNGVGKKLVKRLLKRSEEKGISELFLLTETAEDFFRSLDFRVVEREKIPESVRNSREFTELCPSTAVAMAKKI